MTALALLPFPLAAVLLAAWLLRSLAPAERAVVAAGAALATAAALLSPSLPGHDAWEHYLHLRSALDEPILLLDPWDRPGFTLLYASPAALGPATARLLSVVLAVVAAGATVRAARALGLAHAWTAGLLLLAQYDLFGQAGSTMTELPFAAAFAVAILGLAEGRVGLAVAGLGWCTITRPEGPLFAALGAAFLLLQTRRLGPVLLALAPFPIYAAVGALLHGDALWIVSQNPYRGMVGLRLELAQLGHSWFFEALRRGEPPVLIGLLAVGVAVVAAGARSSLRPLLLPLLASFLLLTFLRIGLSDAWRESRYLVTIAPVIALLAAAGLDALLAAFPRLAPPFLLAWAAWGAAWAFAWHWRPEISGFSVYTGHAPHALAAAAAVAGAAPRLVPPRTALAFLLALPLALAPPGAWARHRGGPEAYPAEGAPAHSVPAEPGAAVR